MKLRYKQFVCRTLTLVLWIVVAYSLYFHHLATQQIQMVQNRAEETANDELPSTDEYTNEMTTKRGSSVHANTTAISEARPRISPSQGLNSIWPFFLYAGLRPSKKLTPKSIPISPTSNRSVTLKAVTVNAVEAKRNSPAPVKSQPVPGTSKNLMDEYSDMGGIVIKQSNASTPVNPHPFSYTLNPQTTCNVGPSSELFLLVYVHTRPDSIKQRELIRSTWGDVRNYAITVRRIFVMGLPESEYVQAAVKLESQLYNDILQENFLDTYRNLTYKAIGALKWVKQYCNHTKFVLKTDDDAFVNMHILLEQLAFQHKKGVYGPRSLICNVWYNSSVPRKGKWAVTVAQRKYPTWPNFCQGLAYIMTPGVAADLYEASFNVPFLWMDDVYITGFLAKKLKIVHTQIAQHFIKEEYIGRLLADKKLWRKALFSHIHSFDRRKWAWSTVLTLMSNSNKPNTRKRPPLPPKKPTKSVVPT